MTTDNYMKDYYDNHKDYFNDYRKTYYDNNKEKYMKKCVCGNCGKEVFRSNLRRHQKSHICRGVELNPQEGLPIIPPLVPEPKIVSFD